MEGEESAVEHAFADYLAGLGSRADDLRAEASRTLERGVRQAHDLGWSQRRIARSLGRSQPEVKRLLGRAVASEAVALTEAGGSSMLDAVLRQHRDDVVDAAARRGVRHLRVFGSVASGEDGPESDVDLLVDVDDGVGLFALGALEAELSAILGRPVDIVPEQSLRPAVRASVVAIPL
ncbi:nucleotidyltransferase domain-containing protein [Isoptericola sp. AK164]|uniref:nucleotidyltransferase family protein n=1 Tax=Isoptericola sp. AK164 TaxID=3024246 RepID=UPI002418623C|nr:nucleotidyltransferase domain-containing protein [Isoptericola sp. AK164]